MDALNVQHAVVLAAAATASDEADEQLTEAELQLEQLTVQGFTVAGCASLFCRTFLAGSRSHSALAFA